MAKNIRHHACVRVQNACVIAADSKTHTKFGPHAAVDACQNAVEGCATFPVLTVRVERQIRNADLLQQKKIGSVKNLHLMKFDFPHLVPTRNSHIFVLN